MVTGKDCIAGTGGVSILLTEKWSEVIYVNRVNDRIRVIKLVDGHQLISVYTAQ